MPKSGTVALWSLLLLLALAAGLLLGSHPSTDPELPSAAEGDAPPRPPENARAHAVLEGRGQATGAASDAFDPGRDDARTDDAAVAELTHALFNDIFRLRVLDAYARGVADVVLRIRAYGPKGPVVTAPHTGAWQTAPSRTDAEGRIEIRGGNLVGGVVAIDFLRGPADVLLPGPSRFAVTDDEVTIHVERASLVTGRVFFDPALPPPRSVHVEARWTGGGTPRSRRVVAEPDGAFSVGGLPPDTTLDLFAYVRYAVPARFIPGRGRPSEGETWFVSPPPVEPAGTAWGVRAGASGVSLRLDGPPNLDVRALTEQGAPVTKPVRVVPVSSSSREPWHARTTSEGRLVIRAAAPGTYRLEPLQASLRAIEIELPYEGESITFPSIASRTLSGRLVGSGDLAGFRVEIRSPFREKPHVVLTDPTGSFSASAPGGPVSLRATRFGDPRSGALRDLPEGVDEVEIVLDRGLAIRGRIVDVNGAPITFRGWARVEGERVVETTQVLLGGHFSFAALPPGTYTLRVGGDGPSSEVVLGGVEAGSEEVTVRLRAPD